MHLARRLSIEGTGAPQPLALIGTFRDDEIAGQPVEALLKELRDRDAAEFVSLGPLNAVDVGRLVTSMLGAGPPGPFIQRLSHETAGVPFFVEETMRALVEDGSIHLEHGTWAGGREISDLPISTSVVNVLRRRFTVLDAQTRALLTAVAVYGRPAPPGTLAAAAELDPPDFMRALRLLLQRQLMVRVPGDALTNAVAHDRMREVLYSDLPPEGST